MSSPAANTFTDSIFSTQLLYVIAGDSRIRPIQRARSQAFLHAGLAAIVASWDAYLNHIVDDFYDEIANPTQIPYNSIFDVARKNAKNASDRFNTPNWENARNFLIMATGYDPIGDWIWPRRKMGVQDINERLNQILKVRHSFAHGFGMQSFPWNTSANGRVRLTIQILRDTESFFFNLVRCTDKGMSAHINTHYSLKVSW